jgi:hypothetical protein
MCAGRYLWTNNALDHDLERPFFSSYVLSGFATEKGISHLSISILCVKTTVSALTLSFSRL